MKQKGVDIISIGDELLIGQVQNTNASWMANELSAVSIPVNRIIVIADDREEILNTLANSNKSSKLVLVTGGLGPTKDDLTKATICDYFDSKLVLNKAVEEYVKAFFAKRGRSFTESNRLQAMVPDNCEVIKNKQGTAPIMHFEKQGTHFVFMPGVPFEMKFAMKDWVLPFATNYCKVKAKAKKTVLTSGMGESFLAERIGDWENNLPANTALAYLPSPGRVRLRITVVDDFMEQAQIQLQKHIDDLKQIIPELIYGYDDDLLEAVVGKMLVDKSKTIATAESCTGGMIAEKITSIPGSSHYFKGSVVAYANEIKANILAVDSRVIEEKGAVSKEVAVAMAKGVRKLMNTDIAVATTGIAGPDGGTDEKPVGTVWIALASEDEVFAKKYNFGDQRERNILWAVQTALNRVRKHLL